jgi:hypothetical protein
LDYCSGHLDYIINNLTEKTFIEVLKIKNPNQTLFILVKLFLLITNTLESNEGFNWTNFQNKKLDINKIKKSLFEIKSKNLNKDYIDEVINITYNYNDVKISMQKINNSIVLILDLLKYTLDYSVKKDLIISIQNTYTNVKLN